MSLLTTDEACELLRVTKKTLYKHVQEGKVPAFMIGTEYRFNRDEVLAALRVGNKKDDKDQESN